MLLCVHVCYTHIVCVCNIAHMGSNTLREHINRIYFRACVTLLKKRNTLAHMGFGEKLAHMKRRNI